MTATTKESALPSVHETGANSTSAGSASIEDARVAQPGADQADGQDTAARRWLAWMGSRLRRTGRAIADYGTYWLSSLLSKRKSLWIFGGANGERFCDNSRHFFQWMQHMHPEIQSVWLTTNPAVLAKLREQGVPCCHAYSKEGYRLALRARVAVMSHSRMRDLNRFAVAGKTFVVQLWHGSPIQRRGLDVAGGAPRSLAGRVGRLRESLACLLFPPRRERFDLLTAASAFTASHLATSFGVDPLKVVATGLARTDRLVLAKLDPRVPPRRIAYLPTQHGAAGSSWNPFDGLDVAEADRLFAKHDVEFLCKLHPENSLSEETVAYLAGSKHMGLFECGDIHLHLDRFDLLVTDSSSVFVDFLVLGRPVAFFPRGCARPENLYFDYDWITPGPKAESWPELLEACVALLDDPTAWSDERAAVLQRFNAHEDGRNCKRIFEAIQMSLD